MRKSILCPFAKITKLYAQQDTSAGGKRQTPRWRRTRHRKKTLLPRTHLTLRNLGEENNGQAVIQRIAMAEYFHEMQNHNEPICNVIYLPKGEKRDLIPAGGSYSIRWFDPRNGGALQTGSIDSMPGGIGNSMGAPPSDPEKDWVVLVRKK